MKKRGEKFYFKNFKDFNVFCSDLIKPTAGIRAKMTPAPVAVEKESIFKKLKPSKHRYSVLDPPRDEL